MGYFLEDMGKRFMETGCFSNTKKKKRGLGRGAGDKELKTQNYGRLDCEIKNRGTEEGKKLKSYSGSESLLKEERGRRS